jgi:hypothetical protein
VSSKDWKFVAVLLAIGATFLWWMNLSPHDGEHKTIAACIFGALAVLAILYSPASHNYPGG